MSIAAVKTALSLRRTVGAALLLFVFFLPLHFHFSFTAQAGKECSCIHGTRAQLAPSVNIAIAVPVFQTDAPAVQETFGWAAEWANLRDARAPPAAPSG